MSIDNCSNPVDLKGPLTSALQSSLTSQVSGLLNCLECSVSVDVNVTVTCGTKSARRLQTSYASAAFTVIVLQPTTSSDVTAQIQTVAQSLKSSPFQLSADVARTFGVKVTAVTVTSIEVAPETALPKRGTSSSAYAGNDFVFFCTSFVFFLLVELF
jgi:hypothetical protein